MKTPDPKKDYTSYLTNIALTADVPLKDIGGMTIEEVALISQIKQKKNKEFAQTLAWVIYNGAALTGVAVNDPKRFPSLEEAFPNLFESKEQQDWWVMKQRIESYSKAKKNKQ